jgi:beta-carotene 3-hydroxylase
MSGPVGGLVSGAAAFVAMEGVSYAAHRWLMHGRGMVWHRSHHPPRGRGLEANDAFPAIFASIATGAFAAAAIDDRLLWLRPIAVGVSAYGTAYFLVHEVFIHRRLRVPLPRWRYLRWLETSHRIHHTLGGEPYGMLMPIVSRERRARASARTRRARL